MQLLERLRSLWLLALLHVRICSACLAAAFLGVLVSGCSGLGPLGFLSSAPVVISVSPTSASIQSGATQQFDAIVTGTSKTGVVWSATAGGISSKGLYAAPNTPGTYTVKATSAADPTKSASATVSVTAAPVTLISIIPTSAVVAPGATQQFTVSVTGTTNTSVNWSVSAGTISGTGYYTAPITAGSYTVTATSVADTTKSASATVIVGTPTQHTVNLTWLGSSSGIAGYRVYRGSQSGGPYALLNSTLLPSSSYSDGTVQSGQTYYYVTTALNSSGVESAYSNQVTAVVPSP